MQKVKILCKRATQVIYTFARSHKLFLIALASVCAVLVWGPTVWANLSTHSIRYDLDRTPIRNLPAKDVGIVFGAGLYRDSTPTPYLRWRLDTAAQLYKAHRVHKLLMTGDNSRTTYDEPAAMRAFAEKLGVPAKDIVLDYAGFNTYDSCYRAKAIFEVHHTILVTQGYHLPRAVAACRGLGLDVIGVDAEHDQGRSWKVQYIIREWFSTDKIVLQLLFKPHPTMLGRPEPL